MSLPRILVIDDQLASEGDLREEMCETCDLVEISLDTTDTELEKKGEGMLAGAVFCSGQVVQGDRTSHSLKVVDHVVQAGWPSAQGWRWALILLDVRFDSNPPRSEDASYGLRILEYLVEHWPDALAEDGNCDLPVIMLSGMTRNERGRAANRAGARAYVEKTDLDRTRLRNLLEEHGLIEDSDPIGRSNDKLLRGRSLALLKFLRRAREISRRPYVNAMILGPQGSGKSILAQYIHSYSRRPGQCLPYLVKPTVSQLEYSTLFGCWKGAHSHADQSFAGLAEQAHRGTLLIDEVHGLHAESQQELYEFCRLEADNRRWLRRLGNFRALQTRDDIRQARESVIGELEPNVTDPRISVDVLVLSATNEPVDDPEWRSQNGFKEPMYMRLAEEYCGEPIKVPSLGERLEDLESLFASFVERATHAIAGRWPKHISPDVIETLQEYDWPGNVAQLQGVAIASATSASDWDEVLLRHLPLRKRKKRGPIALPPEKKIPGNNDDQVRISVTGVLDLAQAMDDTQVVQNRSKLKGALKSLSGAYGRLLLRILESALDETKDLEGRLKPTPAMNLLFSTDMSSSEVASQILRLVKLLPEKPQADSDLGRALIWAKNSRQTKRKDGVE